MGNETNLSGKVNESDIFARKWFLVTFNEICLDYDHKMNDKIQKNRIYRRDANEVN